MRTLVVALIVAVLIGAISTEVYFRLLDGSHLGLLVLIVMACVTSALASPRIAARSAASGASPRREGADGRTNQIRLVSSPTAKIVPGQTSRKLLNYVSVNLTFAFIFGGLFQRCFKIRQPSTSWT